MGTWVEKPQLQIANAPSLGDRCSVLRQADDRKLLRCGRGGQDFEVSQRSPKLVVAPSYQHSFKISWLTDVRSDGCGRVGFERAQSCLPGRAKAAPHGGGGATCWGLDGAYPARNLPRTAALSFGLYAFVHQR